jgi:hypothetical protein
MAAHAVTDQVPAKMTDAKNSKTVEPTGGLRLGLASGGD